MIKPPEPRFWLVLGLLLQFDYCMGSGGIAVSLDGTCTDPLSLWHDFNVDILSPDEIALSCQNFYFDGDSLFLRIQCVDGDWDIRGDPPLCLKAGSTECSLTPDVPANAVLDRDLTRNGETIGKVYKCSQEGDSWLSGESLKIAECLSDTWTPIFDVCDQDCPLPRDCSEMIVKDNDLRYVVPDGTPRHVTVVECKAYEYESPSGENQGWTLVARRSVNSVTDYADVFVGPLYDEEGGIPANASNADFFIGMTTMAALSHEGSGEPRPLTIRIEVYESGNSIPYHMTYTNVVVDESSLEIVLNGSHHGNLDNCWAEKETVTFFTEGRCALLAETMKWGNLDNAIETVLVYIRPQSYDDVVACPALDLSKSSTTETSVVEYPRSNGTVLRYKCIGNMMKEPLTLQTEDELVCQSSTDAPYVPSWNKLVFFPCELFCPDNYFKSWDLSQCLHISEEGSPLGVFGAAKECRKTGSSVYTITDLDALHDIPDNGDYYYTFHVAKQTHDAISIILSNLTCVDTVCWETADEKCLAVSSEHHKLVSCFDPDIKYMCNSKVTCPENYVEQNGTCYKVLFETVQMLDALVKCKDDGAALAYPVNEDELKFIAKIVRENASRSADPYIKIGLNDVHNWTSGGMYEPDEYILTSVGTTSFGNRWRLLLLSEGPATPSMVQSHFSNTSGAIVCQYPAYADCRTEPPSLKSNMHSDRGENALELKTRVSYGCYPGYFLGGDVNVSSLTYTCFGQLGEWYPATSLPDCEKVEVCVDPLPVPPTNGSEITTNEDSRYLNGTALFTCPDLMLMANGTSALNLTCSQEQGLYNFTPETLQECYVVCYEVPNVANASTDWNETIIYFQDSNVTATCEQGYRLSPGEDEQLANCTEEGVWDSYPCYPACVGDLPHPGENMAEATLSQDHIGSVLNYSCNPGYNRPISEEFPDIRNFTQVTCNDSGVWEPEELFECIILCLDDPPTAPSPISMSWDVFDRKKDSKVEYNCGENKLFSDSSSTKSVTCEESSSWSALDANELECIIATLDPPLVPGANETSATLVGPDPPIFEGGTMNYTCEEGKLSSTGVNFIVLTFTEEGWTGFDPEFICYNTTDEPPEIPNVPEGEGFAGTFETPDPPIHVSLTAIYKCPEDTATDKGETETEVVFTENGWSELPPEFICLEVTYLPPAIPVAAVVGGFLVGVIPPFPIGETIEYTCKSGFLSTKKNGSILINSTYLTHTKDGWTDLDPEFVCVPDPNASIPPPTTEPPFRFPDANVLENGYDKTTAVHMPSLEHFLTNANEDAPEFMLTAGPFGFGYAVALNSGDRQCLMRKNYAVSDDCSHNPKDCTTGFSMSIWERLNISFDVFHTIHKYHEDEKRYVLSTGGDHNGHPGVSIYHQGLYLIAVVSTGDEYWEVKVLGPVAINEWNNIGIRWIKGDGSSGGLELYVNARKVGQVHEGKSAVAKAELAPTELLIGCHRDADDAVYRHYNDADFDEFALWTEWLDDEETIYFLGGYEGESENLDPEEFAVMLERTNLRDPEQAAIAMAMFNGMADQLKDKNNTTGEEGNSTELNEGAKKLKGLADAFAQLTNPHLIKRDLTLEELESYAAIIDAASKMFDESLETDWDDIEATGHRGSIGVKKDLEEYIKTICKKLKFDGQPLNFTRTTDNIAVKIDKMTVSDFKGLGKFYITPNFRESKQMLSLQSAWDLPSDKVEVPTDVISDPRCRDHPISVATAYYDTFDDVGPSTINPEEMNAMVDNEVDSRVISVDIVSDATDLASPSTCEPEKKKLEKNPLFITKEHKMKNFTQRSLKFHEGENTSPIYRRICVWWNYTIGVQGAWDATGCSLLVTNQFFSKCACAHSGTFSIIAEYLEEREVMEEPYWATVVKYIGHILSAICIVFYVLVVGLSGDLKDQFHISGVFLALSVLGGGIALLISDSDRIRDGRHSCTAIGSLIHALYLNAAAWVAMIGHAGFKAVTGGIIGGFMNPYIMISSGVTLVSVGFTYLFFIFDLGTDPRCFISWFNEIKFLFFFPVLAYAMAGIFFNCVIYFNTSHASKTKKLIMHDYGNFALGSTFMIFYFTLVWILGFMSYMRFEEELGAYPWFQVFNSFMGVVILIGLGLCSTKFKMVLAGQAKRRRELLQKLHLGQGKNVGGNKLKNDVGPAPTQIKS